ncbi:hypothetical protein [Rhizobium sp. SYY.PMSO]|uniref:hypothetical protein n=1 Tax=Rhizobium sp. SYY.PMSO TaxID=3382192 RepID=UPI0039902FE5
MTKVPNANESADSDPLAPMKSTFALAFAYLTSGKTPTVDGLEEWYRRAHDLMADPEDRALQIKWDQELIDLIRHVQSNLSD